MSEVESPDSTKDVEEEGTDDEDESNTQNQPNKLSLSAGDLSVEAESYDESVAELACICYQIQEDQMRYYTLGEMEMIEQENLFDVIFEG